MASSEAQERWLERKRRGETKILQVCLDCDSRLRGDSAKAPRCFKCWLKTEEGKKYMRSKKKESRKKLGSN